MTSLPLRTRPCFFAHYTAFSRVAPREIENPTHHLIGRLLVMEPRQAADNLAYRTLPLTAICHSGMMFILVRETEEVIIMRDDQSRFALRILPMRYVGTSPQLHIVRRCHIDTGATESTRNGGIDVFIEMKPALSQCTGPTTYSFMLTSCTILRLGSGLGENRGYPPPAPSRRGRGQGVGISEVFDTTVHLLGSEHFVEQDQIFDDLAQRA